MTPFATQRVINMLPSWSDAIVLVCRFYFRFRAMLASVVVYKGDSEMRELAKQITI